MQYTIAAEKQRLPAFHSAKQPSGRSFSPNPTYPTAWSFHFPEWSPFRSFDSDFAPPPRKPRPRRASNACPPLANFI